MRGHAEAIGPASALLLDFSAPAPAPAGLVALAHAAGLSVQGWVGTGDASQPPPFRRGDTHGLLTALFATGLDSLACDAPALAVKARRDALAAMRRQAERRR